jgi:hypothetical protein
LAGVHKKDVDATKYAVDEKGKNAFDEMRHPDCIAAWCMHVHLYVELLELYPLLGLTSFLLQAACMHGP